MQIEKYFGDWLKVIDVNELFVDISNKVKEIYGVPIKWYEEY